MQILSIPEQFNPVCSSPMFVLGREDMPSPRSLECAPCIAPNIGPCDPNRFGPHSQNSVLMTTDFFRKVYLLYRYFTEGSSSSSSAGDPIYNSIANQFTLTFQNNPDTIGPKSFVANFFIGIPPFSGHYISGYVYFGFNLLEGINSPCQGIRFHADVNMPDMLADFGATILPDGNANPVLGVPPGVVTHVLGGESWSNYLVYGFQTGVGNIYHDFFSGQLSYPAYP